MSHPINLHLVQPVQIALIVLSLHIVVVVLADEGLQIAVIVAGELFHVEVGELPLIVPISLLLNFKVLLINHILIAELALPV